MATVRSFGMGPEFQKVGVAGGAAPKSNVIPASPPPAQSPADPSDSIGFSIANQAPQTAPAPALPEVPTSAEPARSPAVPPTLVDSKGPTLVSENLYSFAGGGLVVLDEPASSAPPQVTSGIPSERECKIGYKEDFVSGNSVRFMHSGSSLFFHAKGSLFAEKPVQLAVSGGGSQPAPKTVEFLNNLAQELGDKAGYVTTGMTHEPGTIDSTLTKICQDQGSPQLPLIADKDVGYAVSNPSFDESKWQQTPKYALQSDQSLASMREVVANSHLITDGGDRTTVSEFIRSIDTEKPVVLFVNNESGKPTLGPDLNDVQNPAALIASALTTGVSKIPGIELDSYGIPKNKGALEIDYWLDRFADKSPEQMLKSPSNPKGLVLIVDAKDPQAAQKAAEHLQEKR